VYLAGAGFGRHLEEEITFDNLYWVAPEHLAVGESPNPVLETINTARTGTSRVLPCDVYAFGLLIYELFVGSTPYRQLRGDTDLEALLTKMVAPIRSGRIRYVALLLLLLMMMMCHLQPALPTTC
jgi:hypothetical protein